MKKASPDFSAIPVADAAAAFGVSRRTLDQWFKLGAPRSKSGRRVVVDLPQLIAWRVERARAEQRAAHEEELEAAGEEYQTLCDELGVDELPDESDPFLRNADSYYQELARKRTAQKLHIENETKRGRLLERDRVEHTWNESAARLRQLLERVTKGLCRKCSRPAKKEIHDGLSDIEQSMRNSA